MKHLVVQTLEKGTMVALVIFLAAGFVSGYMAGDFGMALLGLIIAFVLAVPFFGYLFLFMEMNDSLRVIRQKLDGTRPQM